MKASPGARSWLAAGVRHELLTRALPALRHDMSAPVSVMRMGLLMLKRQVAAPVIDAAACEERVALIDHQIGELVSAVRSLRDWELATDDAGITRRGLVAQCTGLMRAAFDLHGIRLEVDETLVPNRADPLSDTHAATPAAVAEETNYPAGAALRYLFLGVLGYLHDSLPDVGAITVAPDGESALLIQVVAGPPGAADPMAGAHRAPRKLAIDAIALQSLAEDLGYALTIERDTVRLPLLPAA